MITMDTPARILHFASNISINSGVMMVIMNYYRNIDRNKIQFDLLYFIDNEPANTYLNEIEQLGGRVYYISHPTNIPKYVKSLNVFFNEHKGEYLAIHIHEVYLTFLLAPIAHAHGLKVITHCHSTQFSDKSLRAIRNRIACLGINKISDIRLACSNAAGTVLYSRNANFTVINNAIDIEKFAFNAEKRMKLRAQLGVNDKVVIGHVGRFNKQKNHKFLIEIFYETQKILPSTVLLLIGRGPLESQVRAQVARLNLQDKVIFMGQRRDVSDLYNAMDIFLLPSLFEGLPVVAVEAQANGLQCLLSDRITDEVAIDRISFVSISSGASEWCNRILKLLPFKRKPGDSGKLNGCGFNIAAAVNKLMHIYKELRQTI